jgi:hypothetical protein
MQITKHLIDKEVLLWAVLTTQRHLVETRTLGIADLISLLTAWTVARARPTAIRNDVFEESSTKTLWSTELIRFFGCPNPTFGSNTVS